MRMPLVMRLALLLILLASAVAGCGGSASPSSDVAAAEKTVRAETTTQTCVAGLTRPVGTATTTYAAVAQGRTEAFRSPDAARLATFAPRNVNRFPTVFAVLAEQLDAGCDVEWYRVQLPMKPNGISGWVRARDVELAPVTTRIEVDLSERLVTLYDSGRLVLAAPAAIGSPETPTPTGRYYVNQRLRPHDPSGPFGPGAIGISAFSEVLTGWAQGGPIAIHGTNRPDLIGRAISNGCIRVRNEQLRRLFARTLAGTPVTVRA
jgi:lipoprotein-anchoring transpeptidase ErfK/SrfK